MYWGESVIGIEVEDGDPIRVPISKNLVEAVHRFLAVGWDFTVLGKDEDNTCRVAMTKLFKREQIKAKVSSAKRFGLIRGDAILHVTANPNKDQGSRISINELDPATYFPIYEIDDPDRIERYMRIFEKDDIKKLETGVKVFIEKDEWQLLP